MSHATSASKKRAATRLPPEEDPEFQIAPMIDILLVLLVFFMSISSTEVLQVSQELTLPVAKDAKAKETATPNGQIVINVLWSEMGSASGSIDIDKKVYARADELLELLKEKAARQPEMRVLIRADRKVRYDYLRTILLVAGNAGIKDVTFSVSDKEKPAAKGAPAP